MTSVEHRKPKRFLSVLGFAFGGQALYVLTQFGVLSSIAHLRGPEAVGTFGLALAITTPVFILANTGLRTSQSIDQANHFSFAEYTVFRSVMTLIAFLVCAVIAWLSDLDQAVLAIVVLMAAAKSCEAFSELSYGSFEKREHSDLVFRSLAIRGVLTFLAFLALLASGVALQVAFVAQLAIWCAVAFTLDFPAARRLSGEKITLRALSPARFWQLSKRVLPVGLAGFATGLQSSLLRISVGSVLGLHALGIFTSVSYVFQAGALLSNAMGYVLTSRFSSLMQRGDRAGQVRQALLVALPIAALCALGILVAWIYGEPLLKLAFGAETSGYVSLLVLVSFALSARVLSAIPNSLHYSRGGAGRILVREVVLVCLVLAASQILLPTYGLIGAGAVMVMLSTLRLLVASFSSLRAGRTSNTQVG